MKDKYKSSLWHPIGNGENNVVFKSLKKHNNITYTFKRPKHHTDSSAEPLRVARKWNLFNPDLPATSLNGPQIFWNIDEDPKNVEIPPNSIYLYTKTQTLNGIKTNILKAIIKDSHGHSKQKNLSKIPNAQAIFDLIEDDCASSEFSMKLEYEVRRALKMPFRGTIAPYIEGTYELSEQEKATAIIQIYLTTRNLLLDYDGEGNLIRETATGQIRCVDFDETICCSSPRENNKETYQVVCERYNGAAGLSLAEQAILALSYMEKHLKSYIFPLETLNKFITAEVISALNEFERKSIPLTVKTLEILSLLTNTYPENKLYLSAESIHNMEVNIDDFSNIEAICNELNDRLLSETTGQYLTFIEPEQFAHFIEEKKGAVTESLRFNR